MRDFSSWSLSLGRWRGVYVRLHAVFLLFGVFTLYLSTQSPDQSLFLYGLATLAILFFSVLAHEVGHCLMALRVGGSADQIVIMPLGGLAQPNVPHEYQHELITALAGPLVNLLVCLVVAPLLLVLQQDLPGLLFPLHPRNLIEGAAWVDILKLIFWINWLLVLVNLLPAFPLDGGRVLRSILWRWFDYRTAVQVVTWGAKLFAIGMCVMAWATVSEPPGSLVPSWVPLTLFAIFLFFSAKQESARFEEQELEDNLFSYDFSQGYTSLERTYEPARRHGPSALRRWWEDRRQARLQKQKLVEQAEERQVDGILARLHETGLAGLSAQERALLERVSARYRNRQGS